MSRMRKARLNPRGQILFQHDPSLPFQPLQINRLRLFLLQQRPYYASIPKAINRRKIPLMRPSKSLSVMVCLLAVMSPERRCFHHAKP